MTDVKRLAPVRKMHLTVAATLSVILNALITWQGGEKTARELADTAKEEIAKVKTEFVAHKLEREQLFVRKDDMAKEMSLLNSTLVEMRKDLSDLNRSVSQIQGYLKAKSGRPSFTSARVPTAAGWAGDSELHLSSAPDGSACESSLCHPGSSSN